MRITPRVCSFAYSCHQHVPRLSGPGGSSIVPPLHGATSRVCHHLIGTAPATLLSPTVKVRVDWNHRAVTRFSINQSPEGRTVGTRLSGACVSCSNPQPEPGQSAP